MKLWKAWFSLLTSYTSSIILIYLILYYILDIMCSCQLTLRLLDLTFWLVKHPNNYSHINFKNFWRIVDYFDNDCLFNAKYSGFYLQVIEFLGKMIPSRILVLGLRAHYAQRAADFNTGPRQNQEALFWWGTYRTWCTRKS